MSKLRLCIDVDNVVARTDEVMRQVIREYTGGRVDLARTDIREFNYWECSDGQEHSITRDEWSEIHELFSEPRYLWLIQPVEDVQQYLEQLSAEYALHLATARLPKARRTTVEWLESHRFPPHSLHFLRHGEKHLSLGKFHAAVEDDRSQAEAFAASGTRCYLLAHPWNILEGQHPMIERVADWTQLLERLLALVSPM